MNDCHPRPKTFFKHKQTFKQRFGQATHQKGNQSRAALLDVDALPPECKQALTKARSPVKMNQGAMCQLAKFNDRSSKLNEPIGILHLPGGFLPS
jgi:hypothetical protein